VLGQGAQILLITDGLEREAGDATVRDLEKAGSGPDPERKPVFGKDHASTI
jgi:hypothetical protein